MIISFVQTKITHWNIVKFGQTLIFQASHASDGMSSTFTAPYMGFILPHL